MGNRCVVYAYTPDKVYNFLGDFKAKQKALKYLRNNLRDKYGTNIKFDIKKEPGKCMLKIVDDVDQRTYCIRAVSMESIDWRDAW